MSVKQFHAIAASSCDLKTRVCTTRNGCILAASGVDRPACKRLSRHASEIFFFQGIELGGNKGRNLLIQVVKATKDGKIGGR
jgi:hypothetical protein